MSVVDLGSIERDAERDAAERAEALEVALPWARLLGAVLDGAPGPWVVDAACKGHTSAMFPIRGDTGAAGRAMCATCPVQYDCLLWAAAVPADQGGIIAGTSERDRQRVRARLAT